MNIVLTGPMGAGKTAVGKMAAEILGMTFADTDAILEQQQGRPVGEMFRIEGEVQFRELESKLILQLSKTDNTVIATGGGAVLRPENMRRLRMNGVIINLTAPTNILLERLKNGPDRPLLAQGKERQAEIRNYLEGRAPYYANTDFRIDTGHLTLQETVEKICAISKLPVIRLCGCIAGSDPEGAIRTATEGGVSMAELRLDLIPSPDIEALVRGCAVPVIATDRKNPENLKKAILAGCEFIDVDIGCAEREEIIDLARKQGCRTIVSLHSESVPDSAPDKGQADFVKIAATLDTTEDFKKLVSLHGHRDDVIIAGMGPLGGLLRVFGPMLGSYLTYCSVGEPTATGQLDLRMMNEIYRGMGLR
ncbi:MAG: type I 3-dehydroquinate dehydratase [Thermoplasmata archaeon]|nr:type I 3-dehydroquinate dehydratase [Thermoplasmata archaeon]